MMETMQQNEMINLLAEEFDLEAASYPILGQGAAAKKIRGNINDFILLLVKKTQNSVLYDGTLMDILVTLLTAFSTSQAHCHLLRHKSDDSIGPRGALSTR